MAGRRYTAWQAREITGVSYSALDQWVRQRLVVPSADAEGSGSDRAFDFGDLLALRAVAQLRQADVKLSVLSALVESLQTLSRDDEPEEDELLAVLHDGAVRRVGNMAELRDVFTTSRCSAVLVLSLADVWADVTAMELQVSLLGPAPHRGRKAGAQAKREKTRRQRAREKPRKDGPR